MERLLPNCLNNLIIDAQYLDKIEILVVNDGSTDGSLAIAKKYEGLYPASIKVIDKKNGNYGSCINIGLKMAQGIFVKTLDSDDSYDLGLFEKYVKEMIKSENDGECVDLFLNDFVSMTEAGNIIDFKSSSIQPNVVLESNEINLITSLTNISHTMIAYRRSLLEKIDYIQTEGVSYTDTEWFILPMLNVSRIKRLDLPVYRYLIGREGQTMSPKSLSKGMNSFSLVGQGLLTKFDKLTKLGYTKNLCFVKYRIGRYFVFVYKMYILKTKDKTIVNSIRNLDSQLLCQLPDIYSNLNKEVYSRKFRFKFILAFRKNGLSFKLMRAFNMIFFHR